MSDETLKLNSSSTKNSCDYVRSKVIASKLALGIPSISFSHDETHQVAPNKYRTDRIFATMPEPPWKKHSLSQSINKSSSITPSINISQVLRQSQTFSNPESLPDLMKYYNIDPWSSNKCHVRKKFKWNIDPHPSSSSSSSSTSSSSSPLVKNKDKTEKNENDEIWFYDNIREEQNRNFANDRVLKGIKYAKRNDIKSLDESMRYFNQALEQCPNHDEALVGRGCLYANSGKYNNAIQDFNHALSSNAQNINAKKYLESTLSKVKQQQSLRSISSYNPLRHSSSYSSSLMAKDKHHSQNSEPFEKNINKPLSSLSSSSLSSSSVQRDQIKSQTNQSLLEEKELSVYEIRKLIQSDDDGLKNKNNNNVDDDDDTSEDDDEMERKRKRKEFKKRQKKEKKEKKSKKHKKKHKKKEANEFIDGSGTEEEEEEEESEHPILSRSRHKYWG